MVGIEEWGGKEGVRHGRGGANGGLMGMGLGLEVSSTGSGPQNGWNFEI